MLVLASDSPRRKKLLELGGWEFKAIPAEIDESSLPGEEPRSYVMRLARQKAITSASHALPGSLVIAADTAVVFAGQIIGKPADTAEAVEILTQLRGRAHQVYTALAAIRVDDEALLSEICVTDVIMRNYRDDELIAYVKSGDPMDKAGAYAIQHSVFDPVERLEGCYTNVVGLPLCSLYRLLGQLDASILQDKPLLCQALPPDPCEISQELIADL
jgi:septum formation protein